MSITTKLLLLTVIVFLSKISVAQDFESADWKLYKNDSTDSVVDSTKLMTNYQDLDTVFNFADNDTLGSINVTVNPKIVTWSKKLGEKNAKEGCIQLKGYRLQVIFGSNENEINEKRSSILAQYPELNTYKTYDQPNYKLRVGDFISKLEAAKYQADMKDMFPGTLLVSELVCITLPNEK